MKAPPAWVISAIVCGLFAGVVGVTSVDKLFDGDSYTAVGAEALCQTGLMVGILIAFVTAWSAIGLRETTWKRVLGLYFLIAIATAILPFARYWQRRVPDHLWYEFPPSESRIPYALQFFHLENGLWYKGPHLTNPPFKVRFPDLNRDDIRVSHEQSVAELIYLPGGPNGKFWDIRLVRGYEIEFPPPDPKSSLDDQVGY
jgi:hypothetical protein